MRRSTAANPAIALAALGVVFGDIGTSPLYTLKTCFTTANVGPEASNAIGIVSVLLWTLTVVVCVKYIGTIMRVDHEGEGGILALLALALPRRNSVPAKTGWLTWVVTIGAAMLFGDGVVTPAISVISAVEGIGVATPAASNLIVPISVAILIGLFAFQARGTEKVGKIFGPVMVAWFVAIAVAGIVAIVRVPKILFALNPLEALGFVTHHGVFGFLVFGAVVLAVTGVEALYADMSHFGRAPIVSAWYVLVFPALICNYLGQGAIVIADPHALEISSPFYALAPGWTLYAMVFIATLATVIASQALISGAFTLAEQAINLYLWPRMTVVHTSRRHAGQVFVPAVNVALGIGCVALVLAFRSSDRLASAYGLAVSTTMLATSIAFYAVVTTRLRWKRRDQRRPRALRDDVARGPPLLREEPLRKSDDRGELRGRHAGRRARAEGNDGAAHRRPRPRPVHARPSLDTRSRPRGTGRLADAGPLAQTVSFGQQSRTRRNHRQPPHRREGELRLHGAPANRTGPASLRNRRSRTRLGRNVVFLRRREDRPRKNRPDAELAPRLLRLPDPQLANALRRPGNPPRPPDRDRRGGRIVIRSSAA
jgi:amino acid transporter